SHPSPDVSAGAELQAEALRELLLSKLAEKPADERRASADRVGGAESAAEATSTLFWARIPPPARKPKVSRHELANAAVRLADADGLESLSMRRLAAELGVGTMTLYHYVRTK